MGKTTAPAATGATRPGTSVPSAGTTGGTKNPKGSASPAKPKTDREVVSEDSSESDEEDGSGHHSRHHSHRHSSDD